MNDKYFNLYDNEDDELSKAYKRYIKQKRKQEEQRKENNRFNDINIKINPIKEIETALEKSGFTIVQSAAK